MQMERLKASVVIPAKDASATIGEQLEALAAQDPPFSWEVVVADNRSVDSTRDVIAGYMERIPGLRVVDAGERPGASYARNVGAAAAGGDHLLFCDADDVVRSGWVEHLSAALDRADAVGGLLEDGAVGSPSGLHGRRERLQGGVDRALGFRRALSSNLGVRREVFFELGGFDETVFYVEDLEFSIRLQVEGYTLEGASQAIVNYRPGDTLRSDLRRQYRWAKIRPSIYKRFRGQGAQREALRGLARWALVIVGSPSVLLGVRWRHAWLARASRCAGHLVGSVQARCFCP